MRDERGSADVVSLVIYLFVLVIFLICTLSITGQGNYPPHYQKILGHECIVSGAFLSQSISCNWGNATPVK